MDVLLPVQPAHRSGRQGRDPAGRLPPRARCRDGCGRVLQTVRPQALRRGRRAVAGRGGELARWSCASERGQRADPRATGRQPPGHAVRTAELLRRQDLGTRAEAGRGHHPAGSDGQRHAPGFSRPAHRPPRTRAGGDAGGRLLGSHSRQCPGVCLADAGGVRAGGGCGRPTPRGISWMRRSR